MCQMSKSFYFNQRSCCYSIDHLDDFHLFFDIVKRIQMQSLIVPLVTHTPKVRFLMKNREKQRKKMSTNFTFSPFFKCVCVFGCFIVHCVYFHWIQCDDGAIFPTFITVVFLYMLSCIFTIYRRRLRCQHSIAYEKPQ